MKTASKIVALLKSWFGKKESDGSHKEIIDIYNEHKPRARGYKVKYTDAWCATTISALAIKLGYTDIIPLECSCYYMIEKAKSLGIWIEDESRVPDPGDIVFYDWDDNGKGDNKGAPEHVGMVTEVNGNKFKVGEGNYSNSVKERELEVNGKYIRGYAVPKYDKEPTKETTKTTAKKATAKKETTKTSTVKVDSAKSFNENYGKTYKTTTSLNMRTGAGTGKKIVIVLPKGAEVRCYGYYTEKNGTKWLLVQYTKKGVKYTGFCSKKYLK